MNNFAILNNKEIKQFDNNVIGFPTSLNDKFILKKELKDGLESYSWVSAAEGSTGEFTFDIDRQFYNTFLTNEKLYKSFIKLSSSSVFLILTVSSKVTLSE